VARPRSEPRLLGCLGGILRSAAVCVRGSGSAHGPGDGLGTAGRAELASRVSPVVVISCSQADCSGSGCSWLSRSCRVSASSWRRALKRRREQGVGLEGRDAGVIHRWPHLGLLASIWRSRPCDSHPAGQRSNPPAVQCTRQWRPGCLQPASPGDRPAACWPAPASSGCWPEGFTLVLVCPGYRGPAGLQRGLCAVLAAPFRVTTGSGVCWYPAFFLVQYIQSRSLAVPGRILNFRRLSQFSSVYARAVRASLY
jgi:hypothetical protein